MTRSNEHWSEWIDHDGGGCPIWPGYVVEVDVSPNAVIATDQGEKDRHAFMVTAANEAWPGWEDVSRFRIRWPRSMQILYGILDDVREGAR